jgi:DNA-binding MarR family transcriptional regulator
LEFNFDSYGSAFLAMRLHRLRVLITAQSDELFLEQGVVVPSHCVSVVLLVARKNRVSIAQIADMLGYSHQLINQRLSQLEAMSLTKRRDHVRDKRKCMIELTAKGRREAAALEATLPLASRAFEEMFLEIGIDLERALRAATEALAARSLGARVASLSQKAAVQTQEKSAHRRGN